MNKDESSLQKLDENKDNGNNEKKTNPFVKFFLNNKLTLTLLLVIIVLFIAGRVQLWQQERKFTAEKEKLVSFYDIKIDSIATDGLERTARVFSWAVRGEMTRSNLEQVSQYFNTLIKEPNISKIMLVDPVSTKIIKSTDSNDEGEIIANPSIIQAERTFSIQENGTVLIVSPVMGIDSKLGIIVIISSK